MPGPNVSTPVTVGPGVTQDQIGYTFNDVVLNGGTAENMVMSQGGTSGNTGMSIILAQSAIAASVTGTTAETALATITIPANVMGPNGALRIDMQWTVTLNADTKTAQVRLGGTSFVIHGLASVNSLQGQCVIRNRGVTNSQVGTGSMSVATTGLPPPTGTIDTTQAQTLTITATLGTTTDTMTLEGYTVELLTP